MRWKPLSSARWRAPSAGLVVGVIASLLGGVSHNAQSQGGRILNNGIVENADRAPASQPDVRALERLQQRFEERMQAQKTPAFYRLKNETDPVIRSIYEGPDRSLMFMRPNGHPAVYLADNLIAAQSASTDQVWPGGGSGFDRSGAATGAGELGEWDGGGVRLTHQEFGGRVTQKDVPAGLSDHSTHVAGTLIAAGTDPNAKGMSYAAVLDAYEWTSDTAEMAAAGAAGMLVSNHSYGFATGWEFTTANGWTWWGDFNVSTSEDYGFGYYDQTARDWDQVMFDAPNYLIVKSAGNDRNDTAPAAGTLHWDWIPGTGWVQQTDTHPGDGNGGYDTISYASTAKNPLIIGAVNDIPGGWTAPGDVVQTSFSSWGPTDDGRIKPDLVANGAGLWSSIATADNAYASYNGTSMASPSTAGSINLLAQAYKEYKAWKGTVTPQFDPRSATMKAVVINNADEAGPADGPDYSNGWGMLNTERAMEAVLNNTVDFFSPAFPALSGAGVGEATLEENATDEYFFTVDSANDSIRVTIAWTDVPGDVDASPSLDPTTKRLKNDLDMTITHLGSGTVYEAWVLDPANPGNAATKGDNDLDNVERIDILSPPTGEYKVSITHEGPLTGTSQDYSISWRDFDPAQPAPTAAGAQIDIAPPASFGYPAMQGSADNGSTGLFVTAIRDFQVSAIGLKLELVGKQPLTVSIYEADGTTRGALLASSTLETYHPGDVYHYVPISFTFEACKEYDVSFSFGATNYFGFWSEAASPQPFDMAGVFRVRDAEFNGGAGDGAFPKLSIIGEATGPAELASVPVVGAGSPAFGAQHGAFVTAQKTVSVHALGINSNFASAPSTIRAYVYEATGTVRGDLVAEGTIPVNATGLALYTVPLSAVLVEGEDYDIGFEFGANANRYVTDTEANLTLPLDLDGVLSMRKVESNGVDPANASFRFPSFQLHWKGEAGGEPYDITTPFLGESHLNNSSGPFAFGHYITSLQDQELYSVGWMANVPAGQSITINVYEANGVIRGALVTSGTIVSDAGGMQWHDVPVAVSLQGGAGYDIEIDWTGAPGTVFEYWGNPIYGNPWVAYGLVEVLTGEFGGVVDASNEYVRMRLNMCTTAVTDIADRPMTAPQFRLANVYPNPMRTSATIEFSLDHASIVSMNVYDVRGRKVATVVQDARMAAGPNTVSLDGKGLASGIYFVKLETPLRSVTRKITVVK